MTQQYIVFDFEGDGLRPTKIHVVSYHNLTTGEQGSLYDYGDIKRLFSIRDAVFIGHNIIRFDLPQLSRLLHVDLFETIEYFDTLALSWYLFPHRHRHGLEEWGEYFGVPKPGIDDWVGLTREEYTHRCEEDVRINTRLWNLIKNKLNDLYTTKERSIRVIKYLNFKLYAAHLAEDYGWKLDVDKTKNNLEELYRIKNEKTEILKSVLPKVPKTAKRTKPKKFYNKDNTLSKKAKSWNELLAELKVSDKEDPTEVEVVVDYLEPNPSSHAQIKDWLFSLGWEPDVFKQNARGEDVPQITVLNGPELTDSVLVLAEREPSVHELNGLFTINHRIGILEGFLSSVDEDGVVRARVSGLTNTLRFKHAELVNLPGINSPYGEYIRPCLVARPGMILCGSDMASLEDRTKQHFMWDWDPDYVREQQVPGFDPHLDIALLGGTMTKEEVQRYRDGDTSKELKLKRHGAKTTNYSCTYNAFPPKIAKTAGIPLEEARVLWEKYWERNWSLKKIAENVTIKPIKNEEGEEELWLFNPVSKFYYNLRHHKDIFSTLNQGTGSYCFDTWINYVLESRTQITAQFHDEGVFEIPIGREQEMEELLRESIREANEDLKLNRELDIGVAFGFNYGEIH